MDASIFWSSTPRAASGEFHGLHGGRLGGGDAADAHERVRLLYACSRMRQRKEGSIVAIESVSVKQPIDKLILSNSIRMAVIGLLKSLANELGPEGIGSIRSTRTTPPPTG
jgi:hypothetical protein